MTFPARGLRLPTAISVGTNPTFQGAVRTVEGHALDVAFEDLDVYGDTMEVSFVERIRGQVAFRGMEPLIAQMHEDVDRVRSHPLIRGEAEVGGFVYDVDSGLLRQVI